MALSRDEEVGRQKHCVDHCGILRGYPCCALTLLVLLRLQEGCFAEQHLFQRKLRYVNHVGAEGPIPSENETYGIGLQTCMEKNLQHLNYFLSVKLTSRKDGKTSFCLHDESSTCKFRTKTQIALKVFNTHFFHCIFTCLH